MNATGREQTSVSVPIPGFVPLSFAEAVMLVFRVPPQQDENRFF